MKRTVYLQQNNDTGNTFVSSSRMLFCTVLDEMEIEFPSEEDKDDD